MDAPSVSQPFFCGPERSQPPGPRLAAAAQDAEPVGIQGFLPATGILIGLQTDHLETKEKSSDGNFAGPMTPDPRRS